MSTASHAATLQRMGNNESRETRGRVIKQRMEALGMGPSDLAEESGLSRSQLYRVFDDAPSLRPQSYASVERALDKLEAEDGPDGPDAVVSTEAGLVEFDVNVNPAGVVHVVAKGPITNRAEMEESIARIVRAIRRDVGDQRDS